jgi:hypothetical protein
MKNLFVPYYLSLKLKCLGFDEPCFAVHNYPHKDAEGLCDEHSFSFALINEIQHDKKEFVSTESLKNSDKYLSAPTWDQGFEFLLQNYKITYQLQYSLIKSYSVSIFQLDTLLFQKYGFDTVEKAKEFAMETMLKNISSVVSC